MPGMFFAWHMQVVQECVSKSALVDAASLHTLTSAGLVLLPILHSVDHILAHALCWPS